MHLLLVPPSPSHGCDHLRNQLRTIHHPSPSSHLCPPTRWVAVDITMTTSQPINGQLSSAAVPHSTECGRNRSSRSEWGGPRQAAAAALDPFHQIQRAIPHPPTHPPPTLHKGQHTDYLPTAKKSHKELHRDDLSTANTTKDPIPHPS